MTTWLPVPGWAGLYEVSDDGQIRSLDRIRATDGARLRGRTLKPGTNSRGYRIAVLSGNGQRIAYPVHRLVAEAFLGPMPKGWHTCHIDGDKGNNHRSNLYYGTPSQNELDKIRQGRNRNSNKTHCPRGHEYSPENTFHQRGKTSRKCRACHREHVAAYLERKRSA